MHVVSRCDAAEVLHLAEEALDEVALPVDSLVDAALNTPVALCRDVGANAAQRRQVDEGSGVVATVRHEIARPWQALDERNRRRLVRGLAGR